MADKRESRCAADQKLPSNWTTDGLSKGKQTGAVRPSPDATQGKRGKDEKRG